MRANRRDGLSLSDLILFLEPSTATSAALVPLHTPQNIAIVLLSVPPQDTWDHLNEIRMFPPHSRWNLADRINLPS